MKYFTISPETTPESLKKQYRDLSKKYHPDSGSPDASNEKFAELNTEYNQVLKSMSRKFPENEELKEMIKKSLMVLRFLENELNKNNRSLLDLADLVIKKNIKNPIAQELTKTALNTVLKNAQGLG